MTFDINSARRALRLYKDAAARVVRDKEYRKIFREATGQNRPYDERDYERALQAIDCIDKITEKIDNGKDFQADMSAAFPGWRHI